MEFPAFPKRVSIVYAIVLQATKRELHDNNVLTGVSESRALRLLSPTEEQVFPKSHISTAPKWYLRITKHNGEVIQPKSRTIILDRLDPQVGTYRTDAPSTSWVAVQIEACCDLGMSGESFDVGAAFLSGTPLDKSVHVRAPNDGLPAFGSFPNVRPRQVLQVLDGAHGWTGAPRGILRARVVGP